MDALRSAESVTDRTWYMNREQRAVGVEEQELTSARGLEGDQRNIEHTALGSGPGRVGRFQQMEREEGAYGA